MDRPTAKIRADLERATTEASLLAAEIDALEGRTANARCRLRELAGHGWGDLGEIGRLKRELADAKAALLPKRGAE